MQMNSKILRITWRGLLTLVFSIVVGTGLANGQVSCPDNANSHTVTIDVSKYPVSYSDPSQSVSAYRLCVKNNDSVVWRQDVTIRHYSAMIFFSGGTPFADKDGRPVTSIVWSDRKSTSPVATVTEESGTYEYHVAVYDEDNNKTYTDDPKIIVGSGHRPGGAN